MATYVIGDVQGCLRSLQCLLKKIQFDPSKDRTIFLGDLINRGPNSLETLRFVYENRSSMEMVLGNHEIFALALYLKAIKNNSSHTLSDLFCAPDVAQLMAWLQKQPFIIKDGQNIFVHAGIAPAVSVEEAIGYAHLLGQKIQGPKAKKFLAKFYQKKTAKLKHCDSRKKLLRYSLSYLTLMRMCTSKSNLNLEYNGSLKNAPRSMTPWFKLRESENYEIFFGHWAALGFYKYKNYYCLDSGCVWGAKLSAWNLEEKKLIQVKCKEM
ncbi:MAG: symmetrical bis(5'-nucleosyl)-tetraphosphatase [Myxococcales bacterium]|nr:symmetrical bis(5'-nucleosyl)-tetraphosphatase [Myxococcales bacterium]USN51359.1 MAG: symmetrical bis(5'-nucleosyl)-tetraphosphatase [Myxococcales bacterium]